MITNIAALHSILAYLDYAEATCFREDRGPWDHPFLNALVVDEELGLDAMEKPIGVWVLEKALIDQEQPRYIDLQVGPNPMAMFQNALRDGIDGVPVIYDELIFKPRVREPAA